MATFNAPGVGFNDSVWFNDPQGQQTIGMRARIVARVPATIGIGARISIAPTEHTIGLLVRIQAPIPQTLGLRAHVAVPASQTFGMQARILELLSKAALTCSWELQRNDLSVRLRASYYIAGGATTAQTIGMRARIILGDSIGLPCWYMVKMPQLTTNKITFSYSARVERTMAMKARILEV